MFRVLFVVCGFVVIRGIALSSSLEPTVKDKAAKNMPESANDEDLVLQYRKSIAELEKKLKDLQNDYENLATENQKLKLENEQLRHYKTQQESKTSGGAKASQTLAPHGDSSSANERVRQLEAENAEKNKEIERLRKQERDLLELLRKQDIKSSKLKNRLFDLGEALEASDGDEEFENGN